MALLEYSSDMFVKTTTSGPRQYVKLVESYRDTAGVPRQRVILTLGRLESVRSGEADSLLNGLLCAAGKPSLEEGTGEVAFAPALSVGDTWLLTALWKELGFADAFRRLLRNRHPFDAERLLRVRVFNRLCDPESKLGILRWLEGTRVPEVSAESVNHHHLLRTMDTLTEGADRVDDALAGLLRPLIDQELAIVFYDLTTIRAEGGAMNPRTCGTSAVPRRVGRYARGCSGWSRRRKVCRFITRSLPVTPARRRHWCRRSRKCWRAIRSGVWCWSLIAACSVWTISTPSGRYGFAISRWSSFWLSRLGATGILIACSPLSTRRVASRQRKRYSVR